MSHNFLGGQNHNKFGNNVTKRHSSKRQRYESSSEKTWSTLRWLQRYDELRQSIEMMCIITKNVGLLPWVVCVSGISSRFDDGSWWRWYRIAAFLLVKNALMRHAELNYGQQRCHSSITSDGWTIYDCELSVTGWTPSSRHLYCFDVRCDCFNCYCWNVFRHPFIIFLIFNLVDEHSSSLHSFRQRLPYRVCS